MSNFLERLDRILEEAEKSAGLEDASFGFPNDRVEIKEVHFGNDDKGRVGDIIHPTDYVKNITRLHHESWIIKPIQEARALLKIHADTISAFNELEREMDNTDIRGIVGRLNSAIDPDFSRE